MMGTSRTARKKRNWREPSRSDAAFGGMTMIDRPEQVEHLMKRLGASLPIPARLTPEVQMTLHQQRGVTMPANCSITWISYAGDEGGHFLPARGSSRNG
jgi:hypothetical protein